MELSIAECITTDADARLLRVVLENLLSNAWKFTAKVDTARIEFGSAPQADGSVAYFVRDNGAGFDMAYADKMFAPFQRLHSGKEFPGTGIGLATVERIIHRHGGRIWAESAVDKGTTVISNCMDTSLTPVVLIAVDISDYLREPARRFV